MTYFRYLAPGLALLGGCTSLDNPVDGTGEIQGRIIAAGTARENSIVWLQGQAEDAVRTDRTGRFSLPTSAAGSAVLHAVHDNWGATRREVGIIAERPTLLGDVVLEPSACLVGRTPVDSERRTTTVLETPLVSTDIAAGFYLRLPDVDCATTMGRVSDNAEFDVELRLCLQDTIDCTGGWPVLCDYGDDESYCIARCTPETCCGARDQPCCGSTCNAGAMCVSGTCHCSYECAHVGQQECGDAQYRVCGKAVDGCLEWGPWLDHSRELADYLDNDCDGSIDEDFRIVVQRSTGTNGLGIDELGAQYDACLRREEGAGPCMATPSYDASNLAWSTDAVRFAIYEPQLAGREGVVVRRSRSSTDPNAELVAIALGSARDPVIVGPLMECWQARETPDGRLMSEHRYLVTDAHAYLTRSAGWDCHLVGWVETGELTYRDPSEVAVWGHRYEGINGTSNQFATFSLQPYQGADAGFTHHDIMWFAWRAL